MNNIIDFQITDYKKKVFDYIRIREEGKHLEK